MLVSAEWMQLTLRRGLSKQDSVTAWVCLQCCRGGDHPLPCQSGGCTHKSSILVLFAVGYFLSFTLQYMACVYEGAL